MNMIWHHIVNLLLYELDEKLAKFSNYSIGIYVDSKNIFRNRYKDDHLTL
jgi:hypothetical protein